MSNKLIKKPQQLINVDEEKCVSCHACISACPVKYCNDGSGDAVEVNTDMCIGCGNCISACTHEARSHIDDLDSFFASLGKKEKMVAIVAPSIVANFPNEYLNINGWLNEIGVEAVFDVSFGAELTAKSYINHLEKKDPSLIIAQPCPAIASYIQIYKPELLKYLVPSQSPMLHTAKMIKEYYPQYKSHKIAVISPCLAKKREFEETGICDFNIGMKSLRNFFKENKIKIKEFPKKEFINPPAERAVLFSSPGGLIETAERLKPGISSKARKIEGVSLIYEYLDRLPETIKANKNPLIIDCLNCEFGCNAGPLTIVKDKPLDEIEFYINERKEKMKEEYQKKNIDDGIEQTIAKYWKENLYSRSYVNLWENVKLKYPSKKQLKEIYKSMHKYSDEDLYNCTSCGYNTCEKMATAIFNNLNRPDNCHFYLSKENEISQEAIKLKERRLYNILETAHDGFIQIDTNSIIVEANHEIKKMLKRNDLIGRSFFEFLDKENEQILKEQIKLRKQNVKGTYELCINQSDGGKIICLVSGSPLLDENNKQIGSFAMVSDITELKLAQEELLQSNEELEVKVEERTREIENNMEEMKVLAEVLEEHTKRLEKLSIVASEIDNAVIIAEKDGTIEWVNEGFRKLFGKTVEEMKGKNIVSENTPENIKKQIYEGIKQKKSITYEFSHIPNYKLESSKKWFQATITPIFDENKNIQKLIVIDSDISLIKEKEAEIMQQKEEIESQRDEIVTQRDFLRHQTKKMMQSINYAKRIQTAILPPDELLEEILPEYFIYFKPRDVVSGDFYWTAMHGDHLLVAAADCTGHGVPGALMSMLGISLLNEIVNNYHTVYKHKSLQANFILNELRDKIKESLRQTGKDSDSKDGMDISLCVINKKTLECQFSGAHNPLVIVRNGETIIYKADKMPIGFYYKEKDSFTNNIIQLQKEDCIYMFSDGYLDQFSEETGRKYMMRKFSQLLLDINNLSMEKQSEAIDDEFWNWKGTYEQIDDIIVIGLKL